MCFPSKEGAVQHDEYTCTTIYMVEKEGQERGARREWEAWREMKVAHASSYARFERRVLSDPMASLERPSRMRERGRGIDASLSSGRQVYTTMGPPSGPPSPFEEEAWEEAEGHVRLGNLGYAARPAGGDARRRDHPRRDQAGADDE